MFNGWRERERGVNDCKWCMLVWPMNFNIWSNAHVLQKMHVFCHVLNFHAHMLFWEDLNELQNWLVKNSALGMANKHVFNFKNLRIKRQIDRRAQGLMRLFKEEIINNEKESLKNRSKICNIRAKRRKTAIEWSIT